MISKFIRITLIISSITMTCSLLAQDEFEYSIKKDAHRIVIPDFHSDKKLILTGLEIDETYQYTLKYTDEYLPGTSPDLFVDGHKVNNELQSFVATTKRKLFDISSSVDQCGRSLTISFSRRKKGKEQDETGNNRLTPIQVTSGESIQYLIEEIFLGGGCFDVMNFSYSGGNISKGTFSNGNPSIEMDDGFFISTTNAGIIPGPNIDDGFSITTVGPGGDVHLAALPGVTSLHDVTRAEFDFIPKTDSVSFKYVFASEEYCEFVNSEFNDVFGFFISGPGINGPYSGNAENIALVPGTTTEVAINTVNTQLNSFYYRDNTPAGQFQSAGNAAECIDDLLTDGVAVDFFEFDGFTAVFEASIAVIPCEEYHIKLALADVGDALWDSGVFFEANSFKAGSGIEGAIDYGEFEGVVYESCNTVTLTFSRADTIGFNDDLLIEFDIDPSSTATEGEDYDGLTEVTIPGGQESITITLEVFEDNIIEGEETIILVLQNSCDCEFSELVIIIDDRPPVEVTPEDFFICNPQVVDIQPEVSGGIEEYTYEWSDGSTDAIFSEFIQTDISYSVTVTDHCGSIDSALFTIDVAEMATAMMPTEVIFVCPEDQDTFSYTVEIHFTGPGPWILQYEENFDLVVVDVDESPYILEITEPGFYELITVISSEDCEGVVDGNIQILFVEFEVEFDTIPVSCNNGSGSVTIIPAGNGPFFIDWEVNQYDGQFEVAEIPSGVYDVTIYDGVGCTYDTSFTITSQISFEIELDTISSVNCADPFGGVIGISINPEDDYQIYWSNGDSITTQLDSLTEGLYSVTVTDEDDCSIIREFLIEGSFDIPDFIYTLPELNCIQTSDILIIEPITNDSTVSIEVFDDANNSVGVGSDILIEDEGQYSIVVIDTVNGCKYIDTINVISQNDQPVANAGPDQEITCIDEIVLLDGSNSTVGINGILEWSTDDGNIISDINLETAEADEQGTYYYTITDTLSGCVSLDSVLISDNRNFPLIQLSTDTLNCANLEILISGEGSSEGPEFEYEWYTINGNIVSQIGDLELLVDIDSYYYFEITDTTNGCTTLDSVLVGEDLEVANITISEPDTLTCNQPEVVITSIVIGEDASLEWTGPEINGPNDTEEIMVSQAGIYILCATDISSQCVICDSVTVAQLGLPNLSAGLDSLLNCYNSEISLEATTNAGPEFILEWTTQNGNIVTGDDTPTPIIDAGGTYIVTITDTITGCVISSSVEIGEDFSEPEVDAGEDVTLNCQFTMIQLDGTASDASDEIEVMWYTIQGNITSGADSYEPVINQAGWYFIELINNENGCSAIDSVLCLIDTISPFIPLIGDQLLDCENDELIIDATGIDVNLEISWTTQNGNIVSGQGTPIIVVDAPGSYTVEVLNTENQCSNSRTIIVESDIELPIISASDPLELNCYSEAGEISVVIDGNFNAEVHWETSDGSIISDENLETIIINSAGSYTVIVTNLENNCSSEAVVIVTEDFELPLADAGEGYVLNCMEEFHILDGSNSGPSGLIEYFWTTSDGLILQGENTALLTIGDAGTYTLEVTNIQNGCSSIEQVVVGQDDQPELFVFSQNNPLCEITTGEIEFTDVVGGTPPYLYSIDGGQNFSEQNIFLELEPGTYSLVVQDAKLCEIEESTTIPEGSILMSSIESEVSLEYGDTYQAHIEINLPPGAIESIVWNPDIYLSCNDCTDPLIFPDFPVNYVITITDTNGCINILHLRIALDLDVDIYVPNVFTPNDDGLNDKLNVFTDADKVKYVKLFRVYDRWGTLVFDSQAVPPNNPVYGWDGTFKGKKMNPAVFVWYTVVTLNNGVEVSAKGDVTLIR